MASACALRGGRPARNQRIFNMSRMRKGKSRKVSKCVSLSLNSFKLNTFGGGGGVKR